MAEAVYLLCSATSIACAVLLMRGYRRFGARLLFWSAYCFFGLALNNVLLLADFVVFRGVDLFLLRTWVALVSVMTLLIALVWDRP